MLISASFIPSISVEAFTASWIEILPIVPKEKEDRSRLSRPRGLKSLSIPMSEVILGRGFHGLVD